MREMLRRKESSWNTSAIRQWPERGGNVHLMEKNPQYVFSGET